MSRQYVILAIGVVSVSFAAILIRLAEAPALVIAAYRVGLASLVLLPIACRQSRNRSGRLSRRDVMTALLSGVFLALHFGLWISSLSYASVTTSAVLVTANPIFVIIASFMLFKERPTRSMVAGVALSMAGAVLVTYGNWALGPGALWGAILAILAALAVTGYVIIGRQLRQRVGLVSYVTLVYGSAGLLLLALTLALGYSLTGYSTETYAMLALLAVVPQLIGHSAINWSLGYLSANLVTIAILGEPVGASIWAYLILGETPTIPEVTGGLMILLGIFIAFRKTSTASRI
jgi:drug/metabolite transporter (DMT)-like permease